MTIESEQLRHSPGSGSNDVSAKREAGDFDRLSTITVFKRSDLEHRKRNAATIFCDKNI